MQDNLDRRRVIQLFTAALAAPSAFARPASSQGLADILGIIENILASVELGSDLVVEAGAQSSNPQIDILDRSRNLVIAQEQIVEAIAGLRLVYRDEIERAINDRIQREIDAELASLEILFADGRGPEPGQYLADKAQRLERYTYLINERFGPSSFPVFAAAAVSSYMVMNANGVQDDNIGSLMAGHANIIGAWLNDPHPDSFISQVSEIQTSGQSDEQTEALISTLSAMRDMRAALITGAQSLGYDLGSHDVGNFTPSTLE